MLRNVAGDKVIVESLTKPGAEIHDYEPTPSALAKAQNVDLVLDSDRRIVAESLTRVQMSEFKDRQIGDVSE